MNLAVVARCRKSRPSSVILKAIRTSHAPVQIWHFANGRHLAAVLQDGKIWSLPFLGLRPTPSTLAQSKERKGSNFAIWQPCGQALACDVASDTCCDGGTCYNNICRSGSGGSCGLDSDCYGNAAATGEANNCHNSVCCSQAAGGCTTDNDCCEASTGNCASGSCMFPAKSRSSRKLR